MQSRVTPIAVIGMGCRLPGGIDSPDAFWQALLRGADLVTDIPPDRWDVEDHYDPERGVQDRSVSRWGGFIDDVGGFDAAFFGFGEREATAIDPQHRLLLETSWEAIEHAGIVPSSLSGSRTGVFVGLCQQDYTLMTGDAGVLGDAYGYTCTPFSMASGRIAYGLGLLGPAITMDTSCSSGLLAVHMACQSLDRGESDLALAGGAMLVLDPRVSTSASGQGMLSPTGRCHTFDVAADGFVRSDGCAVVMLKRLADAERDGDRILAVVRGTAANQDGRSETITTPSSDAQAAVYRAALDSAGVDPATVGMVEAHGTGTPKGDPLEFTSLTEVYGAAGNRVALGSAKANVGHTEAAAGAVGLVKAVLGLRHGVVPPMAHFTRLPDELKQIDTGLFVPQEVTPWPDKGDRQGYIPRRAGVTSFGMSGTNVHAVLEQAPETATGTTENPKAGPLLFVLSSTSADELRRTAQRLGDWVDANKAGLAAADVAYTLARRRGHRTVRTAVAADDLDGLTAGLREIADGETPYLPAAGHDDRGPVWIFSGQGSQWAAMGSELLANEPAFAATVAQAEPLIAAESGFSVTEAMSAPETVTGIGRVQPTLFTFQVAMANAMKAHGVQPGAVIGHSMGEIAAAVVAGALSLEDGVTVICRRSALMSRVAGAGAMASVELPAQQVRDELAARGISDVVVSVIASPNSTVIGGAAQPVRDLVADWEAREVMAREVAVDVASHTTAVDPILADLAEGLAGLTPMAPNVPYYSATLDDPRTQPAFDAGYWVNNLRQSVKFAAAVQAALDDGHRVFGEPSPHPLLTRAVEQTAAAADITVAALAGMRREQPVPHGLLGFLADLHSAGAAIDFSVLYPGGRLVDAPLPTWTRQRLLVESSGSAARDQSAITVHPLLGAHVRLPEEPERHAWQGEIGTAALLWLADHQVNGVAVFPGAGFCEMALASAAEMFGSDAEVRDVRFEQMLLMDDETPVSAVASVRDAGVAEFVIETDRDGERTRRATAVLHAAPEDEQPQRRDIAALLATHPQRTDGAAVRRLFAERGVDYGPAFTGLVAAHNAEGKSRSVVVEVELPRAVRTQQGSYGVHPALLDACFQAVLAHPAIKDASQVGLLLPLSVRRLRRYAPMRHTRYCQLRIVSASESALEVDLDLLDETGAVLLACHGLRMAATGGGTDNLMAERLLTVEWQRQTLPAVPERAMGSWLLINTAEADLLGSRLADALKSLGAQPTTLNWPEQADHSANTAQLSAAVRGGLEGVVIVCPPPAGRPDEQGLLAGREQVRHVVRMIRELPELSAEPPRLFVLTRRAQIVVEDDDPNLVQAGLRGLLRVVGAENPQLQTTQIDLQDDGSPENVVEQVAQELLSGSPEDETAWRGGQWYTARLRCTPLGADERRTTTVNHESDQMRAVVRHPGDLQTMEFVAFDRKAPESGQVEIAVDASSVNFAEVLAALGRYPDLEGEPHQLGFDLGGVVTRVGDGVTDLLVGDRVGGFSGFANGSWGTFVTCDARLVAALPAAVTTVQAAAAATAYGTAWYGLYELARICAEDKVLIHSGTGGVGQAAIAIAKMVGAEIFATAGSPERRELLRNMGIEHVYDSRSTAFADEIRRDTDGYGVDIVLNSLTGAAQHAGIELLAYGGRFVEIGKRDIYADARLGLFPFRRNLTFYAVDLALLTHTHPRRVQDLLCTLYQRIADGDLPAPSCTEYPLSEAATAIRVMSGAEHTGKLVLTVARTGQTRAVLPPEQAPVFRKDGAYIVTGGLGGLGLFLAGEMAKAGCGRIVLTARSAPTTKARQAIERLRANGTDVVVESGNIAEADTAAQVVAAATATGLPLRGVLHAAAVVEDAVLANITDELIDKDWAPKVNGVWNLHHATAGQPLDWFCAFSSVAALFGSAGQGAYAAASSWLDAFTRWRRSQGLPATTIAWGAWGEIGRATFLAAGGRTTMIAPDEGAQAFETLLRYDRGYTGYVPTAGAPWLAALVARSPFAEAFQESGDQHGAESSALRAELRTLSPEEWPARLRRLIADQTGLILRRAIDPDRPFAEHGLDSLGNLELRTRIEAETGIRVTPKTIATFNSARTLGLHLSEALAAEEGQPAAS